MTEENLIVESGPFEDGWDDQGGEIPAEAPEETENGTEMGMSVGDGPQTSGGARQEIDGTEPRSESEADGQDQLVTLRHLGEDRQVTLSEVQALAQKGLDYDRIREKLDAAREEVTRLRGGTPAPEGGNAGPDQARQRDFLAFTKAFPDVDPGSIPREVWQQVREGGSLTGAYARYASGELNRENSRLRRRIEELELREANRGRAAGSMGTAGEPARPDPFEEGWGA